MPRNEIIRSRSSLLISASSAPWFTHFASSSDTWPRVSLMALRCGTTAPPFALSFCISEERVVLISTSMGTPNSRA